MACNMPANSTRVFNSLGAIAKCPLSQHCFLELNMPMWHNLMSSQAHLLLNEDRACAAPTREHMSGDLSMRSE